MHIDHLDQHLNLTRYISQRASNDTFVKEYKRMEANGIVHTPFHQLYYNTVCARRFTPNSYFVTINWKPGVQPVQTTRLIDLVLKKVWIPREYYYVYEQRGTDSDSVGTGYHNHFLFIDVDHSRSHIQREIYSTVKNLVGNKMHVDVRPIPLDWKQDKIDYMLGKKWDPEKDSKCITDCEFRLKNNLLPFYKSTDVVKESAEFAPLPALVEGA